MLDSQRLFGDGRFLRPEPFEWVYEGIVPALPCALLANGGKADPLALAVTYSIVAARLGLDLTPLPALWAPPATAPPEMLPHLAARLAARTSVVAPELPQWLLRIEGALAP